MTALPFLSALPSTPTGTPLEKQVTSTNPASALVSEQGADDVFSPSLMNNKNAESYSEADQAQSFWDTLQQQAASSDLAQGQKISALSRESDALDGSILNDNAYIVEEITIEKINLDEIQIQGLQQPTSAPWSMAALQTPVGDTHTQQGNLAMDQILSQRSAQPQLQPQAGVLSPIELQSKSMMDGPLIPSLMTPVITEEVAKASQSVTAQFLQSTSVDGRSLMNKQMNQEAGTFNSGLSLDASLLVDEPINIHEKPITLTMPETLTPATTNQSINAASDAAFMDGVDGFETLQASTGQNVKELVQSSKVLDSSNQMADKVLAGQAKIDVPPSSPKFTEQIAQRIGIMSTEQLQTARIQLDPPELGSLEIKIRVQQDQVSVSFTSGHQVVRDALEAQAPRLRDMLEQQGVELTDVNVSDQQQQSTADDGSEGVPGEGSEDWVDDEMNEEILITEKQSDSIVDYFA